MSKPTKDMKILWLMREREWLLYKYDKQAELPGGIKKTKEQKMKLDIIESILEDVRRGE